VLAPELLSLLRCPKCKGNLRLLSEVNESLECADCRLRFPVRDDIPIMLIDTALRF
jgi:uncharacterized protein